LEPSLEEEDYIPGTIKELENITYIGSSIMINGKGSYLSIQTPYIRGLLDYSPLRYYSVL